MSLYICQKNNLSNLTQNKTEIPNTNYLYNNYYILVDKNDDTLDIIKNILNMEFLHEILY